MVQEVAVDVLKREGMTIVSVREPNNFLDTLFSKLVRQLIAALNQFMRSELIARLREARERQLLVTTRKTLDGTPKVTGRSSGLEGPRASKIRKALRPWVSKPIKTGSIANAQRALTKEGVKTKRRRPVSIQQAKTWLMSLKKAKQAKKASRGQ